MISVTRLPFLLPVGFFAIRFRCLLPAISDRLRFYRFLLACIETRLGILRGASMDSEQGAHLVCVARKEAIKCVEVEFLPSATDGGEHTFTSGMGDQRAPLPVPLANLLFKFLFLRKTGARCLRPCSGTAPCRNLTILRALWHNLFRDAVK